MTADPRIAGPRGAEPRIADPRGAESRRAELAAFLRSRRERLRPEDVGLPPGGRRRTPGLRREEVAQLAGVGVTWYTWLEQGRRINASPSVLDAIARSLRLHPDESRHLFALSGAAPPERPSPPGPVDPVVQRVLDALDPYPAHVVTPRYDLVAGNRADRLLMGDWRALPQHRRNVLWLLFTEPSWRRMLVDWDAEAAHSLALFRGASAEHVGEPAWSDLVRELTEVSPDFAAMWNDHAVASPTTRVKLFLHSEIGPLRLETRSLWLREHPDARMVVYTAADAATEEALSRPRDLPASAEWSELARRD
ncbi:helix-turn-helix transcriptional regulator [Actinopolymorpha cephalotaxi]|uniref:Transcriptional regulator with XRE-family HTH domain n=1 Tax=Actinopolymorpha cephalotaxi TaxID=504797 RepID=A0ABX2RV75_9ACTN|nr:helix-turn-helix transcriptional regulator [Actinopolymorpha cephalotaxi]NYH81276.1 transcriptional regulator with XRE-family HTH domain [Actinopolymorpha cephalotaxi]